MCPPSSFSVASEPQSSGTLPLHLPDFVLESPVCSKAYVETQSRLPPAIFNHSLRVFYYAQALGKSMDSPWANDDHAQLVFVACLFHDIGSVIVDDPQRFEVCGADAAASFLHTHDVDAADIHEVWTAIACHTSPGIGERISPLARLVRLGPLMDFHALQSNPWVTESEKKVDEENFRASMERLYPRLDIDKVLSDMVAEQGMRQPTKAPATSWAAGLVRAAIEEPEWKGVNKAF